MYTAWTRSALRPTIVDRSPGTAWLLFILAHIPLGLAMHYVSFVTAAHAIATVGVGLWWTWSGERLERVAYFCAYITGAEVLWRMTNDHLPWELGKYAIVFACACAVFRVRGSRLAWAGVAFSLLLPSAVLTIANYSLSEAENQISFNLSGPLALCICGAFFSIVSLSNEQFQQLCLWLVAPVTGIAAITLFVIVTNPNLQISHQSNFALSGGFGPNQVSAALGLGAFMALMFLFDSGPRWFVRVAVFAVMVWLGVQSALTFSRGGLFAAAGGALAATMLRVGSPRALIKPVAIGLVVFALGYTVLWPRLDSFTGGNISERFTETDPTLRAGLAEADLQLWRENRVLGVGPGRSKLGHLDDIIAHTEFTRLLAEHGSLGVLFMVLMAGSGAYNAWRGYSGRERGFAAAFTTWSLLFMSNSAMRLVAPSFMFGLAFCTFRPVESTAASEPSAAAESSAPRWRLVSSN